MFALLKDKAGATAIEYALIAALISIVAIAALRIIGEYPQNVFDTVAENLGPAEQ